MNFGNPTPVFYAIVVVLFLGMVATAIGANVVVSFVVCVFASYILFIASVGGFKSEEAFLMGAGWGIFIMIPSCVGALITTTIGYFIRKIRLRRSSDK